jgi:Holliday junction resolvasome RuvABC ATP-dependent DNA helicase subunit
MSDSTSQDPFEGYIGNEDAVARLRVRLARARKRGLSFLSECYLFFGPASAGKSTLAEQMASGLAIPLASPSGMNVESTEELVSQIDAELKELGVQPQANGSQRGIPVLEYPPCVVYVDEAQELPKRVQGPLLDLLGPKRAMTVSGEHPRIVRMSRTTFVLATNEPTKLRWALRSRCLKFHLTITRDDQIRILRRQRPHWSSDNLRMLSELSRFDNRQAAKIAEDVEPPGSRLANPTIQSALRTEAIALGLAAEGLNQVEVTILDMLSTAAVSRALLRTLASEDDKGEVDEGLKFLRRLKFVELGTRGQFRITRAGRDYQSARAKGSAPHRRTTRLRSHPRMRIPPGLVDRIFRTYNSEEVDPMELLQYGGWKASLEAYSTPRTRHRWFFEQAATRDAESIDLLYGDASTLGSWMRGKDNPAMEMRRMFDQMIRRAGRVRIILRVNQDSASTVRAALAHIRELAPRLARKVEIRHFSQGLRARIVRAHDGSLAEIIRLTHRRGAPPDLDFPGIAHDPRYHVWESFVFAGKSGRAGISWIARHFDDCWRLSIPAAQALAVIRRIGRRTTPVEGN